MKFPSLLLALAATLLAAPAARAQDIGPVFDMSIIPTNAGLQTVEMAERKRAGLPNKYAGKSATLASPAANARTSFAYAPTATLQKQTADAYVAQVRAVKPEAATTVAEALAGKTNYPALYHELNNGTGLRENDAADVMALYLLESWVIANGVTDAKVITPVKTQAVRAQAAGILARNTKLSSGAALAQFGEQLKLNAAMLEVGRLRSQHDNASATYRQKVAAQFQRQYHFDMTQLQLTSQGLTKK